MKKLFSILTFCGALLLTSCASAQTPQTTPVLITVNTLFGGAAYNQPMQISAVNSLVTDGMNLWAGTYQNIPASTTNVIVNLYPNAYLLTVRGVRTPARFSIYASDGTNQVNIASRVSSGPMLYLGTNWLFTGTNITTWNITNTVVLTNTTVILQTNIQNIYTTSYVTNYAFSTNSIIVYTQVTNYNVAYITNVATITNLTLITTTVNITNNFISSASNNPALPAGVISGNGVGTAFTGNTAVFDAANANTNIFGGLLSILGSSVVEGTGNTVSGSASHAEGFYNTISGNQSHVEGVANTVSASGGAHAEGVNNAVNGNQGHAEGYDNTASGYAAHVEGNGNVSSGNDAHAEGLANTAGGNDSFAGGHNANATNDNTFVWSDGTPTGSSTNKQFTVNAANGIRLLGGLVYGNGAGLSNLNLAAAIAYANTNAANTNYILQGGSARFGGVVVSNLSFSIATSAPPASISSFVGSMAITNNGILYHIPLAP